MTDTTRHSEIALLKDNDLNLLRSLSTQAKVMLDLIYDHPGINTKTIQRRLKLVSRHTFLKYINELIENELVFTEKNIIDKRENQYQLTDRGRSIRFLSIKKMMNDCLTLYLTNCEKIFLSKNPNFRNSFEWIMFKENIGYTDNFIENIEDQIYKYILTKLENIQNNFNNNHLP